MTSHANRGIEWQRILEEWHDEYRRARRAVIWPTPPRVRVCSRVGANGQFRASFVAHGPPDYMGALPGGRAVVFDAKDCAELRWGLGQLELHQARDLEATHDRGGLAFVALRFGAAGPGGGRGYVLGWAELGPRWWAHHEGRARRGEGSIREGELGAQMPELGDWLGAIRP